MQKNLKKYINNKKIFILGASSDIGCEVVKKFLNDGYTVIGHYNTNKKKLSSIKASNLSLIKFNLKDVNKFEKFIKKNKNLTSVSNFLSLTGYQNPSSIYNFTTKDFYEHINVNYLSNIIFLKYAYQFMQKNKFGRILLSSSIGTKFGGGINTFAYSISKFLNEFIPNEIRKGNKNNVLYNIIQIGLTNTKLLRIDKSKNLKKRVELIPIKRMAKPSEVGNYIHKLLSEKNSLLTNQIINISGGE